MPEVGMSAAGSSSATPKSLTSSKTKAPAARSARGASKPYDPNGQGRPPKNLNIPPGGTVHRPQPATPSWDLQQPTSQANTAAAASDLCYVQPNTPIVQDHEPSAETAVIENFPVFNLWNQVANAGAQAPNPGPLYHAGNTQPIGNAARQRQPPLLPQGPAPDAAARDISSSVGEGNSSIGFDLEEDRFVLCLGPNNVWNHVPAILHFSSDTKWVDAEFVRELGWVAAPKLPPDRGKWILLSVKKAPREMPEILECEVIRSEDMPPNIKLIWGMLPPLDMAAGELGPGGEGGGIFVTQHLPSHQASSYSNMTPNSNVVPKAVEHQLLLFTAGGYQQQQQLLPFGLTVSDTLEPVGITPTGTFGTGTNYFVFRGAGNFGGDDTLSELAVRDFIGPDENLYDDTEHYSQSPSSHRQSHNNTTL